MSAAQHRVVVAVDGGGTGCRAAVGTNADGILAQASGKSANVATGWDGALQHMTDAVAEALVKAGLGDTPLAEITAHVGVAGANSQAAVDKVAAALPYGQCTATADRETTVAGALGEADGYVLALGTGPIIASQHNGVIRHVAGWGFKLSDQAAGAWLGRRLLEEVLLAHDGMRAHSDLSHAMLASHGGLHGVIGIGADAAPGDYARLATQIVPAAAAGDAIATALMQEGAAFLEAGLDALGFVDGDRLSLTGGLGPKYESWLAPAYTRAITPPRGTALQGAFALACKAAKVPA